MQLWFVYAFGAAILWGLGYAVAERVLGQKISPAFLLLLQGCLTLPVYFIIARHQNALKAGWEQITSNTQLLGFTLVCCLTVAIGNFLILASIGAKNATLANFVEISYPFFTFLFAWLLFKDVQLTVATAIGGALILSGIAVMYFKG